MQKLIAITAAAIALAGCATTPTPIADARPVPAERIYVTNQLPAQGNAHATFVRDSGMFGGALSLHVYVDGTKLASLDPGESTDLVIAPGERILGVMPTNFLGAASLKSIEQNLKPNQRYFYRLLIDTSGQASIQRFVP